MGIVVVLGLLVLSVIFNIFLFSRGHQSYSIKYELFMKDQFFRQHPIFCNAVEVIYHIFFAVPFLLLLIAAIMRAVVVPVDFVIILINGLIVLLTIYPTKAELFYRSRMVISVLVVASQFTTLYVQVGTNSGDYYTLLSSILYPVNCMMFCMAVLAHEDTYWEIDQAIALC